MTSNVENASPDGRLPSSFDELERARINARRTRLGLRTTGREPIGLAFSGGGIRSATVSLGFMQGLAKRRLLAEFDYLSTVSGGGYIGSFYGSLHLPGAGRAGAAQSDDAYERAARAAMQLQSDARPDDAETSAARAAPPPQSDTTRTASWKDPTQFLRDNGNYLAPNGGGDLMLASAIAVRNWIGVQYLIGISLVTLLFGMSALRSLIPGLDGVEALFAPRGDAWIWWSPWWLAPLAVLLVLLIPIGSAYWLTENDRTDEAQRGLLLRVLPTIALLIIGGAALLRLLVSPWRRSSGAGLGWLRDDPVGAFCGVVVLVALITLAIYLWSKWHIRRTMPTLSARQRVDRVRNLLTNAFVDGPRLGGDIVPVSPVPLFVATVVAAAVDTLGQSLLLRLLSLHVSHAFSWAAFGTVMVGILRFAAMHLGDASNGVAKKIPLGVVASVAAAVLVLLTLTFWSIAAHAMLICFPPYPRWAPGPATESTIVEMCTRVGIAWDPLATTVRLEHGVLIVATFVVLLILAVICGLSIGFLNLSTLQRLYSTRLTRAYLGASNPNRLSEPGRRDVTELVEGDNIELKDYYSSKVLAPVHLINVTLNTTVAWGGGNARGRVEKGAAPPSGDSRLVHRNNRGMSMCVGPAGISVGAQYAHLSCDWERSDEAATPVTRYTGAADHAADHAANHAANHAAGRGRDGAPIYLVESMSLGDWCAASGAAVSTGLGARTRTGLSLLLGIANVRLGYWWSSSVPARRWHEHRHGGHGATGAADVQTGLLPSIMPRGAALSFLYRALSTQICLMSELIGRFYGPRRRRWYLTDGGHFENTAAYELIRRRLPLIVMLDNGADHEYAFDDLANLIRRVRLDFQIELTEEPPRGPLPTVLAMRAAAFTTLEQMRTQKKWGDAFALCFSMSENGRKFGYLVVVKPRVAVGAPADIRQYAARCEFPQQSTLEQFFDEAEWESYRKLGEMMALKLV